LIADSMASAAATPSAPKIIITTLPAPVRFSPRFMDSMVSKPRQPSRACTTKTATAVSTMFKSDAGIIHFQPKSINWS
jgi:hypothetical protein